MIEIISTIAAIIAIIDYCIRIAKKHEVTKKHKFKYKPTNVEVY